MPLHGTLEGFALTDILQIISVGKITGVANLTDDEKTVRLVFRSGRVIHANSPTEHRLGTRLVAGGYLTADDLDRALEEQQTRHPHTPLASLLVELNLVRQEILEHETEAHIKEVFDSLLDWTDGVLQFKPTVVPESLTVLSDGVSTEELLLGAVIAQDERALHGTEGDPELENELLGFIP
jgi:hypothetical protein